MSTGPYFHRVGIKSLAADASGQLLDLTLDGTPLVGVTRISLEAEVGTLTEVTLTMYAGLDVDVCALLDTLTSDQADGGAQL